MKLLDLITLRARALNQRKIYTHARRSSVWYKRFFIDEDKGAEVAA